MQFTNLLLFAGMLELGELRVQKNDGKQTSVTINETPNMIMKTPSSALMLYVKNKDLYLNGYSFYVISTQEARDRKIIELGLKIDYILEKVNNLEFLLKSKNTTPFHRSNEVIPAVTRTRFEFPFKTLEQLYGCEENLKNHEDMKNSLVIS